MAYSLTYFNMHNPNNIISCKESQLLKKKWQEPALDELTLHGGQSAALSEVFVFHTES
jgi:hypothetical protein